MQLLCLYQIKLYDKVGLNAYTQLRKQPVDRAAVFIEVDQQATLDARVGLLLDAQGPLVPGCLDAAVHGVLAAFVAHQEIQGGEARGTRKLCVGFVGRTRKLCVGEVTCELYVGGEGKEPMNSWWMCEGLGGGTMIMIILQLILIL